MNSTVLRTADEALGFPPNAYRRAPTATVPCPYRGEVIVECVVHAPSEPSGPTADLSTLLRTVSPSMPPMAYSCPRLSSISRYSRTAVMSGPAVHEPSVPSGATTELSVDFRFVVELLLPPAAYILPEAAAAAKNIRGVPMGAVADHALRLPSGNIVATSTVIRRVDPLEPPMAYNRPP